MNTDSMMKRLAMMIVVMSLMLLVMTPQAAAQREGDWPPQAKMERPLTVKDVVRAAEIMGLSQAQKNALLFRFERFASAERDAQRAKWEPVTIDGPRNLARFARLSRARTNAYDRALDRQWGRERAFWEALADILIEEQLDRMWYVMAQRERYKYKSAFTQLQSTGGYRPLLLDELLWDIAEQHGSELITDDVWAEMVLYTEHINRLLRELHKVAGEASWKANQRIADFFGPDKTFQELGEDSHEQMSAICAEFGESILKAANAIDELTVKTVVKWMEVFPFRLTLLFLDGVRTSRPFSSNAMLMHELVKIADVLNKLGTVLDGERQRAADAQLQAFVTDPASRSRVARAMGIRREVEPRGYPIRQSIKNPGLKVYELDWALVEQHQKHLDAVLSVIAGEDEELLAKLRDIEKHASAMVLSPGAARERRISNDREFRYRQWLSYFMSRSEVETVVTKLEFPDAAVEKVGALVAQYVERTSSIGWLKFGQEMPAEYMLAGDELVEGLHALTNSDADRLVIDLLQESLQRAARGRTDDIPMGSARVDPGRFLLIERSVTREDLATLAPALQEYHQSMWQMQSQLHLLIDRFKELRDQRDEETPPSEEERRVFNDRFDVHRQMGRQAKLVIDAMEELGLLDVVDAYCQQALPEIFALRDSTYRQFDSIVADIDPAKLRTVLDAWASMVEKDNELTGEMVEISFDKQHWHRNKNGHTIPSDGRETEERMTDLAARRQDLYDATLERIRVLAGGDD